MGYQRKEHCKQGSKCKGPECRVPETAEANGACRQRASGARESGEEVRSIECGQNMIRSLVSSTSPSPASNSWDVKLLKKLEERYNLGYVSHHASGSSTTMYLITGRKAGFMAMNAGSLEDVMMEA